MIKNPVPKDGGRNHMKDTRRPGAEKADRLWKGFASGIKDRIKDIRNSISHKENEARDMGDTHTPVSRLDLTGLNQEQAKSSSPRSSMKSLR